MSDTYTKLFSSITESTVWGESYATRIVWVTMLAMADSSGSVYGAVPGLARRANVTLQEVEIALQAFLSPDPYSRSRDEDGRRVEEIDGGWKLINHAKYSAIRGAEERREYKRQWDRENRPSGHQRGQAVRQQSDSSPTENDSPATPALTPTLLQQEQEQEHVQPSAARSRFAEFWAEYPNKKGRQEAEKTWLKRKLDPRCDDLIAHVRLMQRQDDDWRRGYVPMGSTYLNQARWEDVPKQQPRAGPAAQQPLGKQMQGVMTLEGMIRERMAGNRNSEGVAATGLLVAGPDSRG